MITKPLQTFLLLRYLPRSIESSSGRSISKASFSTFSERRGNGDADVVCIKGAGLSVSRWEWRRRVSYFYIDCTAAEQGTTTSSRVITPMIVDEGPASSLIPSSQDHSYHCEAYNTVDRLNSPRAIRPPYASNPYNCATCSSQTTSGYLVGFRSTDRHPGNSRDLSFVSINGNDNIE